MYGLTYKSDYISNAISIAGSSYAHAMDKGMSLAIFVT